MQTSHLFQADVLASHHSRCSPGTLTPSRKVWPRGKGRWCCMAKHRGRGLWLSKSVLCSLCKVCSQWDTAASFCSCAVLRLVLLLFPQRSCARSPPAHPHSSPLGGLRPTGGCNTDLGKADVQDLQAAHLQSYPWFHSRVCQLKLQSSARFFLVLLLYFHLTQECFYHHPVAW